jgi:hypothetical protein
MRNAMTEDQKKLLLAIGFVVLMAVILGVMYWIVF